MRDQFVYDNATASTAEKALQELQANVIKLLDAHTVGIILFDSAGGLITCNKRWEELYQLKFETIRDYNMLEDTNLQKKHIWEPISGAFRGMAGKVEENYFSPEEWGLPGRARWTEGTIIPLFDRPDHSEQLIATALFLNDVTERKMTALELEHLRKRLSEIHIQQEDLCRSIASGPVQTPPTNQQLESGVKLSTQVRDRIGAIPRREREIFEKLAAGYTVKEVAHMLGLGIKSVYTYRMRLLKRLELAGDVELAIAWRQIFNAAPGSEHP